MLPEVDVPFLWGAAPLQSTARIGLSVRASRASRTTVAIGHACRPTCVSSPDIRQNANVNDVTSHSPGHRPKNTRHQGNPGTNGNAPRALRHQCTQDLVCIFIVYEMIWPIYFYAGRFEFSVKRRPRRTPNGNGNGTTFAYCVLVYVW